MEKGSAKNFHTGKFLSHTAGSTVESAMFAPHQMDNFLLRFFLKKRMGLGATPHFLCVFFLLAFSFALAVSKEKAVCGVRICLGFATFLKKLRKNFHTGKFLSHIVRSTVKSAMFAPF